MVPELNPAERAWVTRRANLANDLAHATERLKEVIDRLYPNYSVVEWERAKKIVVELRAMAERVRHGVPG